MGAGALRELDEAIDQVVRLDVAGLAADELHRLVVGLEAARTRLVVAASAPLQSWEREGAWQADGSLNAALALARDAHCDHRTTRTDLRRARFLQCRAHVRAAALDGRISVDHVDLLMRAATSQREALFTRDEEVLVGGLAALRLFDDANRLVRSWVHLADDELSLGRSKPAPSTLYLSRLGETGEAVLDGHLAPIDAEIVAGELKRLTAEVRLADRAAGIERTPAQRRAAALVQMARRSAGASGPTPRPLFQVVVGDETARRLCQLASGHVVHPDDLEPHLDDALLETFLFDGPTTVIASSHRRTFTGALRRAIQVRDRRCQHDSVCPVPAVDCDVDHVVPVSMGGITSQFDGRAACATHNRFPHLRDHPTPRVERTLTVLDELRCKLCWRFLRDEEMAQAP